MSGLRFFADHCVANSAMDALRSAGHEVLRLRDELPPDSLDSVVIQRAQELDAILLTLNGDFTDIVSYPPQRYRGIVALRARNNRDVGARVVARQLEHLASHPQRDEYVGRLYIVEPHQIRVRTA